MANVAINGTFDCGYRGTMFEVPSCNYRFEVELPGFSDKKLDSLLRGDFESLYKMQIEKTRKKREAQFKKALTAAEKDAKSKPPKDMQKFLSVSNQLIEQGLANWQKVELPKLVKSCWETVKKKHAEAADSAGTKETAVLVVKVAAAIVISLGVGAALIAGAALAPMATTAAIIGASVSAVVLIAKAGKFSFGEYDSYQKHVKKSKDKFQKLKDAVEYREKKDKALEYRSLGPKEKMKLLMGDTKALVKQVEKELSAADAKFVKYDQQYAQAKKDFKTTEAELKKVEALVSQDNTGKKFQQMLADAKFEAGTAARELEKLKDERAAIREIQSEFKAYIADMSKPDSSKRAAGVTKAMDMAMRNQAGTMMALKVVAKSAKVIVAFAKIAGSAKATP